MSTRSMTTANPFQDFLEGQGNWYQALLSEMPLEQYYSSPAGRGFTRTRPYTMGPTTTQRPVPRRQRFFDESYQDIYRDFLGNTGEALRAGGVPQTWDQFLQTDPWTKRFTSLPQSARGRTGIAYNPRTRFLYNFFRISSSLMR